MKKYLFGLLLLAATAHAGSFMPPADDPVYSSATVTSQFRVGSGTNISTFTSTSLSLSGAMNVSSVTVTSQILIGQGVNISTLTPTFDLFAGSVTFNRTASIRRGTQTGIASTSMINITAPWMVCTSTSTSATVTVAAVPTISTTTHVTGTYVTLTGTDTVTGTVLVDNGTLSGSLLELGAATRLLGTNSVLELMLDGTAGKWKEVSFTAN